MGLQVRLWRYERRTRWDQRTLAVYAAFLEKASSAFQVALIIAAADSGASIKAFEKRYREAAAVYEELVLLDRAAREDARRLTWILWNVGKQTLPDATSDLSLVTCTYRDARYHLRWNAQRRLGISAIRGEAEVSDECDESTHDNAMGRPPTSSPWNNARRIQ
jgi:hypothetical protein